MCWASGWGVTDWPCIRTRPACCPFGLRRAALARGAKGRNVVGVGFLERTGNDVLRSLASPTALALVLFLPGCAAHRNAAAPLEDADTVASETGSTLDAPADVPTVGIEPQHDGVVEFESPPAEVDTTDLSALDETDGETELVADTVEDPAVLVAEALEACESARTYWQQGDIDEALATLDHAYALLLEIPTDDPEFNQGKEDLRHLISRRVVEIYRSRLTSAVDLGSPIPLELNTHVEREVKNFQGGERSFFLESYRRSGLYRPITISAANTTTPSRQRRKIYLVLTRPTNMSARQVPNSTSAVDKFAGAISAHTISTGTIMGKKASLKLAIYSCFWVKALAMYTTKASLAKSEG